MRALAVFILLVLNFSSAKSDENYAFTPIDASSGLSGNQVRNITQLPDGRMVITTVGLINIYDGSVFNYLHYTDRNSIRLSGYSGFHHDYVARNGYMWLKNWYRLFLIDINRGAFASNSGSLLKSWGVNEPLKDFFMDKEKTIWLITEKDELYYLPEGQREKQLFRHNISRLLEAEDQVYDVAVLNKKLFLFFRSGVLVCFDLNSKKELYRQQALSEKQGFNYAATSFVMPGKKQFFQLRNGEAGGIMLSYDPEKRNWSTVLQTNYWLNYLSIDKTGNIWVTCKEGMWHLNPSLTSKEFIPKLKLVDGQAINTEVSTIYHDNQGGMWLGTLNRGLLYYHPARFKFKNIGKTLFPLTGDVTVNISCFAELGNGEIAVGTQQGLFVYNERTGIIRRHPSAGNLNCNAIFRDRKGRMWIGTSGQGLVSLTPGGIVSHYPSVSKTIYSILENSNSTLTLSTDKAGFGVFNPESGEYQQVKASKVGACQTVFQLAEFNKENIAGICSEGLFIYNKRSGKIKLYPDSRGRGYNTLLVDKFQRLWLGSKDGLHLWDIRRNKKQSFYTNDGLINNYIQSLVQAPDGAIWISTSGGLTKLNVLKDKSGRDTYSFSGFNKVDGVIANEFWERSAYVSPGGNVFWGGIDGFNILLKQKSVTSKQTRTPLFVDFLLYNKKVEIGAEYDNNVVLKDPLPSTKEIVLNHNQNFFSFEFSALNYINPTQTYYRYQLVGVDDKEQELQSTDGRGRFNYTNLQPGTYTFKVRAADNSKDWTNKYAEIRIVVKAPFWKTPLAYCFYMVIAISGVVAGTRFYILQKRKKLVREQQEKLNEMKSAFLKNINEELSEPLTQIIDPLDNILKYADEGRLKIQLKEVQNNALDLRELVNQLSEGMLSPVSPKENELNMEVLLLNMRKLLELQKERQQQSSEKPRPDGSDSLLTAYDEKLIQRALKYVEENLDNPDYTVEQLSKDMGMDRTGLYRKLVHVIGKTPTSFIRSVRLKRAALLLEEGLTVAEVADRVGFSTSSYLTKCFQEEFGMKPSQYMASLKQKKNLQE